MGSKMRSAGTGIPASPRILELARLLKQTGHIAQTIDREMASRHGLALTDLSCLGFLENAPPPVSAKMIAEHVGLSSGATTALLDRLEREGYVERQPNPADRRGITIRLVEARARPVLDANREWRDHLKAIIERLSDEEAAIVIRFLSDVTTLPETALPGRKG